MAKIKEEKAFRSALQYVWFYNPSMCECALKYIYQGLVSNSIKSKCYITLISVS